MGVGAAAPLIALVAMVVVIRLAQLDIGFVRSRTEIVRGGLQPDYGRAHVARYTALYSSLATQYAFSFPADPARWSSPSLPSSSPGFSLHAGPSAAASAAIAMRTRRSAALTLAERHRLRPQRTDDRPGRRRRAATRQPRAAGWLRNRTGLLLEDASLLRAAEGPGGRPLDLRVRPLGGGRTRRSTLSRRQCTAFEKLKARPSRRDRGEPPAGGENQSPAELVARRPGLGWSRAKCGLSAGCRESP